MSGRLGRLSWPTAEITARAVRTSSVPADVRTVTVQVAVSSSQRAATTSVSNRMCSWIEWRSITSWKYFCSSGCWA